MGGLSRAATDVADLVALIDRLEGVLERSGLAEIELEVGGRTVVLRSPAAITALAPVAGALPAEDAIELVMPTAVAEPADTSNAHAVVAPLTGIFYHSPSPGAAPYVNEGDQVTAGQVIGLIEAMKLFNEIKSDVNGTVHRLVARDGDLVTARETLIEVEPA